MNRNGYHTNTVEPYRFNHHVFPVWTILILSLVFGPLPALIYALWDRRRFAPCPSAEQRAARKARLRKLLAGVVVTVCVLAILAALLALVIRLSGYYGVDVYVG